MMSNQATPHILGDITGQFWHLFSQVRKWLLWSLNLETYNNVYLTFKELILEYTFPLTMTYHYKVIPLDTKSSNYQDWALASTNKKKKIQENFLLQLRNASVIIGIFHSRSIVKIRFREFLPLLSLLLKKPCYIY